MTGKTPLKALCTLFLLMFFGGILLSQVPSGNSVKVKIALDTGTEKADWWEKRIRPLVEETFQVFEETFRIHLHINQVERWNPGKETRSLYGSLLSLQNQVRHGENDIILGFIFQSMGQSSRFGAADYLSGNMLLKTLVGSHIIKIALRHELCHLFGAIDLNETNSIMNRGNPVLIFDEFTKNIILLNKFRSFEKNSFPIPHEQLDEAIALYKERQKRKKSEADIHTMLAILHIEKQDYESAIKECRLALDLGVRLQLQVHNLLGIAFRKSGRINEAIKEYESIINTWPMVPETHYNLGIAYMKQNRVNEAIQAYQKAAELNPNFNKAYANMGYAFLKQGNTEKAIQACEKALEIYPQYAEALSTLGAAFLLNENYKNAEEASLEALKLNEKLPGAHINMGTLYLKKAQSQNAIQEYTRAIELDSKNPEAHYNLGRVYLLENRVLEAEEEFKEALELDPLYLKAMSNLALCYLKMELYENAAHVCERALDILPNYIPALTNLVHAYLFMGKFNMAEEACLKVLSVQTDLPEVFNLLGILYIKKEQPERAEKELLKALAIEPDHLDAHLNLGNLYFAAKRLIDSEKHYKKVIQIKPDYALVHNNLSVIYFHQSKYSLAWDYLKRAESLGFKIHPDFKKELIEKLRF
ncbi:tetratricopeptide repeat protein [Acidobacteriota bacterium]